MLKKLVVPASIEKIYDAAFAGCSQLTSVQILCTRAEMRARDPDFDQNFPWGLEDESYVSFADEQD